MIDKLKSLDQKFSWSFFGFIIGIIGIGFTIYTIFFYKKAPLIKYEIISNTSVLDIKENISKLDILFDSVSIKKTKQNLRVITLKISNEGNENFNADFFDAKFPLGFQIEGGEIVQKPQLLESSNKYIKETLELTQIQNKIIFSNIIIDQGEYFTIKTLTLSNLDTIPQLEPLGYVSGSGVPRLVISNEKTESSPKTFIKKLLYGNFGYHILRFFLYIIVIGLTIALIAIPTSNIQEKKEEKKQKRNVAKFKENTKIDKEHLAEKVFDFYLKRGESYLFRIKRMISEPEKLLDYETYLNLKDEYEYFDFIPIEYPRETRVENIIFETKEERTDLDKPMDRKTMFDRLVEEKIIVINSQTVSINQDFSNTLDEFIYFIKIQ